MLLKPKKFTLPRAVAYFCGILLIIFALDTAYKVLLSIGGDFVPSEIPSIVFAATRVFILILLIWYMRYSWVKVLALCMQCVGVFTVFTAVVVTHLASVYPGSGLEIIILYVGLAASIANLILVPIYMYMVVHAVKGTYLLPKEVTYS